MRARRLTVACAVCVGMLLGCDSSSPAPVVDAGPPVEDAGTTKPCTPVRAVSNEWMPEWSVENQSCYRPVDFETPCKPGFVTVALQPELAAPPLKWLPCENGAAGCLRRDNAWKELFPVEGIQTMWPSVLRTEKGYRVGTWVVGHAFGDQNYQERSVVYDEEGQPIAVWRIPTGDEFCALNLPLLTPSRVWMGAAVLTKNAGVYVSAPYDALATASDPIPFQAAHQGYVGADDLLATWGVGGGQIFVYDRLGNSTSSFGGPSPLLSLALPTLSPDAAFFIGFTSPTVSRGYVWAHDGKGLRETITPPEGQTVRLFASDGATVVWVTGDIPASFTPPVNVPNAFFWTSTYAVDPGQLVPVKRRPAPVPFAGAEGRDVAANDGYLAFQTTKDADFHGLMHVYRLSDMHHWQFDPPTGGLNVAYVDRDEIWMWGNKLLYRQRIDALGAGDAAPALK